MSTLKGGVKLRYDSRDRHAHIRFGQTATFTDESNFGFDLYKVVEPESAVSCTAFSTTKVRASQTKVQYDIDDLWNSVPHNPSGADPRDTLGTAIKLGLKDAIDIGRDYGIKGYYRADTGNLDAFDNARSAMTLNQSSLMINTYWYREWNNTPIFGKMPIGKTKVSSHSYVIVDWKVIDGETVFLIDSHQGQKRYMPRETFNQALSEYGTSTLMPSIQAVLDERNKTVFEMIADVLKNAWILVSKIQIAINNLKVQPLPPQAPQPTVDHYQEVKKTIMPNKIEQWAKIIARKEGAKPELNNPGNFKYSTLMASWGGEKAGAGSDGGNFCKFPTYDIGFTALKNFLTLGCENQLIGYHIPPKDHPEVNPRTIKGFTLVYTNFPEPKWDYSPTVIKELGVTPDTLISTFLS